MTKQPPRATGFVLFILCVFFAYLYIDRANVGTAAGEIRREFGLSNTQLGLLFSAFSYSYTSVVWIGGWFGDRFGARVTLFVCGLIFSFGTILTGYASNFTQLLLARGVVGLGEAPFLATASRALTSWIRPTRRGVAVGLTHASSRIGSAVAPPIVASLITTLSWRDSFLVLGGAGIVLSLIWLWYFRNDPRQHPGMPEDSVSHLDSKENLTSIPYARLFWRYVPLMATFFCYGWTLWVYLNWLPSFFSQSYHLKLEYSAVLSAIVLVAGIVGDLAGGALSDGILAYTGKLVLARTVVISVTFVISALCMLPIMLSSNLAIVTAALALAFFFAELSVSAQWLVTMDISPKYVGTAGCFLSIGFALSGVLSPTVFGYLVDHTGNWRIPFGGSIVLLLAGAITSFTLRPHQPFTDDLEATSSSDVYRSAAASGQV